MALKKGWDCWIYFLQSWGGGPIKIGICRIKPEDRIRTLQTGNPEPLRCIGLTYGLRAREKEIHQRFQKYRIRGEWFDPAEEILEFVRQLPQVGGLDPEGANWQYGPGGGWRSKSPALSESM